MAVRYAARSPEQLRSREVEKTSVGAWSTVLVATFETDPDVLASVLPQPLEPSSRPLAKATFASVDIPGLPTFGAGSVSVQCMHEGTVGYYCLVMPMSTEQSVIGGRETFGEPKKIGQVTVTVDGDDVRGTMGRMGVTFAEFTGRVTRELDVPPVETRTDFYFKALPAPDGKGLDADPSLVYCTREETVRWVKACEGELVLRESRVDPVADLPVRALTDVTVGERNSIQRGRIHSTVPAAWIVPFMHQRYDDLSPLGEG
ncbi:MAG TPA: acetoacetate decarboxylase family protein [Acidimicrobiales bacterium]|nr:acetoacetate decarboxylase family protein [Acidimicrobiales bacterium]